MTYQIAIDRFDKFGDQRVFADSFEFTVLYPDIIQQTLGDRGGAIISSCSIGYFISEAQRLKKMLKQPIISA